MQCIVCFKANYISEGNKDFFNLDTSKAMRGFWCLIVVLVHIPQQYQNRIQDMIGSFAYIGVTFFFLTSAYGLSAGKNKELGLKFWQKRLPKLIVPNWFVNLVFGLFFFLILDADFNIFTILHINKWVQWLLGCYLVFWVSYTVNPFKCNYWSACLFILLGSIVFYYMNCIGIIQGGTWCPEVFGFIWGMILFVKYDEFKKYFVEKWFIKVVGIGIISLLLGLLYISGFKSVIFWGDYLLKILLGLAILCFILVLNCKIHIGNTVIRFLGDVSFEVYLIHGSVFKLIAIIFPDLGSGTFILLSLVLTILFATMVHFICSKFIIKFTSLCKLVSK